MTDIFDPEKRGQIMRAVRNKHTGPERLVRATLHRMGYRFRLHVKELPGTPDIVLPRHRKVIQVQGCFWHAHPGCPRARLPEKNAAFWQQKIAKNIARDEANQQALYNLGWDLLILWTCQIKKKRLLEEILQQYLNQSH